ncbi:MAG: twin-arginine translocase TatA/TatE family subunit [Acidobacteria bacterium]|nr:MAG: twin-arginine translocase TatA/TatE family subunit [Acidobacteriota bacterium]
MFSFPRGPELLVLLILLVLIFGARKLPEIGRGLGEGIKNFRASMKEISDEGGGKASDKRD